VVSDKNYLVKCYDCDFEREAYNATYAMNLLQWHKDPDLHRKQRPKVRSYLLIKTAYTI